MKKESTLELSRELKSSQETFKPCVLENMNQRTRNKITQKVTHEKLTICMDITQEFLRIIRLNLVILVFELIA